jgi:hypothetical protein
MLPRLRPVHLPVSADIVPPGWKSVLPLSLDEDEATSAFVKWRWQMRRAMDRMLGDQSILVSTIRKKSTSWSCRYLLAR